MISQKEAISGFLHSHRLPETYHQLIETYFAPLAKQLAEHRSQASRPLLIGINGSQGSGKSTLASILCLLLEQVHGKKAIALSIDDFYLTRKQRIELSQQVHPLLATRGVPGTHDTRLMEQTLNQLITDSGDALVPRFDKATDDRFPASQWERVATPLDIVLVEGWCLGTSSQPDDELEHAINELETREDTSGRWRQYVNQRLRDEYEPLYRKVDIWIMLQAPSFETVYEWRLEQEHKLAAKTRGETLSGEARQTLKIMTDEEIARFIQHYQRLTEHGLRTLPSHVHYLFKLNQRRRIIASETPVRVSLP